MVHAPMRLARLALPHMRASGGGRIVNVSSIAGRASMPFAGHYTGAKHALEALSDALRMEVAGAGVKVVLVEPGGFKTGIWEEFERDIAEIEEQIRSLLDVADRKGIDVSDELENLRDKLATLREETYRNLRPIEQVQVARHPRRPYTLDYIERCFTDWVELHGDRCFRDDEAIVAGWARLDGHSVMLIGHQKGRDMKENLRRNFGMPHPEGYRKALRLMQLAEKFHVPVFTLIDTPGAWAGLGAEERGQSEAIARNLFEMSRLQVPIVATVIGEGGSGGALALGVADRVLMLENPALRGTTFATTTLYAGLQVILPGESRARTATRRTRCASSSRARARTPPWKASAS